MFMNVSLDQALNSGSLLITLYAIAAILLYVVFIRKSTKAKN